MRIFLQRFMLIAFFVILIDPLLARADDNQSFNVNIPNPNGSYSTVLIVKSGAGFKGPQGEFYPAFPTIAQLEMMYGHAPVAMGHSEILKDAVIVNDRILDFDGGNPSQIVRTGVDGVLGGDSRTFTAWVKTDQTGETRGNYSDILAYGDSSGTCGAGFRLATYDNYGHWGPAVGKTGISIDAWCSAITVDAPELYDNQWHFIAVSIREHSSLNRTRVYLDGQLLDKVNVEYASDAKFNTTNDNSISIGGSAGQNLFKGSIGAVRMYHQALSSEEIYDLYQHARNDAR